MDTFPGSSEAGPSNSGSLTPTPMPSDAPMGRDPDECRALAFRVYKEVWDEFNKWKVENCEQQLLLLQKPLPPLAAAEDALLEAYNLRDGEPGEVEIIYLCDSEDDIPLHPGGSTVLMCETFHLELPADFAHPRYESCTPAMQSITIRPGSAAENELDVLPFVPYADDPTFDAKAYLRSFGFFAWEGLEDPDVEVIQFETFRRLYSSHRLSQDEIDATGVLPPLRTNNREGLIFKMTQRDELFWPGMMADSSIDADGVEQPRIDPRAHEPDIDDLRGRLNSIVPYFCSNPGCIQAFCPRHAWDFPPVQPTAPRVTSNDYPGGEPCGSMCFREIDDTFMEASLEWVEPDIDELQCILEIIPDTLPCGLAILVRKPCREVYIQRRRLIPDDRVYPESAQTLSSTNELYRNEKDPVNGFANYLSPGPCSHTGPCDKSNPDCTCVGELILCSHNCQCSPTCQRRWGGCRCKFPRDIEGKWIRQTCAENACPCRKKGWECDPSVCQCDNATYLNSLGKRPRKLLPRRLAPDGKHFCQNSDIQRGLVAKIEIKRGAFGLGAFAVNRIRDCQFIGEYIGELIPDDPDKREPLREHINLNYNFGYNGAFNLDSWRVGNETRYINHGNSADGSANAEADTKLVFGDQRIGFWANRDIKKGEEILFDYGENYWKNKKPV